MPGPEHCHKCPNYVTIYLTYSTPPPPYPLYLYPCLSMSPFGGALCLSGMSDGISWSTHPFLSHLDSRTSTHKGDWVGEGRKELLAWRPLVHKVSEILPICFSNDLFVFHPQTSEYFGCSCMQWTPAYMQVFTYSSNSSPEPFGAGELFLGSTKG